MDLHWANIHTQHGKHNLSTPFSKTSSTYEADWHFKWSSGVSIDKHNYSDDKKTYVKSALTDTQNELPCHIFMKETLPKNVSGPKLQLRPSNRTGCTIPTGKVKLLLLFQVLSEDDQTGLVNAVKGKGKSVPLQARGAQRVPGS